jgi:hypothetical protein
VSFNGSSSLHWPVPCSIPGPCPAPVKTGEMSHYLPSIVLTGRPQCMPRYTVLWCCGPFQYGQYPSTMTSHRTKRNSYPACVGVAVSCIMLCLLYAIPFRLTTLNEVSLYAARAVPLLRSRASRPLDMHALSSTNAVMYNPMLVVLRPSY